MVDWQYRGLHREKLRMVLEFGLPQGSAFLSYVPGISEGKQIRNHAEMRKRKRQTEEANILRAVTDLLEAHNILYIRHHPIRPVTRDGKHIFIKVTPSQRGAPDIIAWPPAVNKFREEDGYRFLAIEVKSKNGKMSEAQKTWQLKVLNAGGLYIVARDIDTVMSLLGIK